MHRPKPVHFEFLPVKFRRSASGQTAVAVKNPNRGWETGAADDSKGVIRIGHTLNGPGIVSPEGLSIVGMVCNIERIRAELSVQPLRDLGILNHRKIKVPEAWTNDAVTPQIPKHIRGVSKCPAIQIMRQAIGSSCSAARRNPRSQRIP